MNLLRLELRQQNERARKQRCDFLNRHFTKADAFWTGVAVGTLVFGIVFVACVFVLTH